MYFGSTKCASKLKTSTEASRAILCLCGTPFHLRMLAQEARLQIYYLTTCFFRKTCLWAVYFTHTGPRFEPSSPSGRINGSYTKENRYRMLFLRYRSVGRVLCFVSQRSHDRLPTYCDFLFPFLAKYTCQNGIKYILYSMM